MKTLLYPAPALDKAALRVYQENECHPYWIADRRRNKSGTELIRIFEEIESEGLAPGDYLKGISRTAGRMSLPEAARFETQMTLALIRLLFDLRNGRPRLREADSELHQTIDPGAVPRFNAADLSPGEGLRRLVNIHTPKIAQYGKLKLALRQYREIVKRGGFSSLPLGKRLEVMGDLSQSAASASALVTGIKNFQARHGLKISGELDQATQHELDVSAEERLETLIINLERWRWLPDWNLQEKRVLVNIAGFELAAIAQYQVALRSPIIVGKQYQETPVFSSRIQRIEFNPYWNVPSSIATNEIAPKLKADPGYLSKQHMHLYRRGDYGREVPFSASEFTQGALRIRQDPGPWNALGKLKFIFPNNYGVYLHDTPTQQLFLEPIRAFSHGCIRVGKPYALAAFLMDSPGDAWSVERIAAKVQEQQNAFLTLPQSIRIDVMYRTAWIDLDGSLQFRGDIYGRDSRMRAVLDASR